MPIHQNPELWFRPSPQVPIDALVEYIERRDVTATPRMGARTAKHEKGYTPGVEVTLRLFDDTKQELLPTHAVRIDKVIVKPLNELRYEDLVGTIFYGNWREVQRDLSLFEGRPVEEQEVVSVIQFSYL